MALDMYKNFIPVLDDSRESEAYMNPGKIDGQKVGYGCIPRDYSVQPREMFSAPDQMAIIPESEYDARYDEQEATKSSLEHLYLSGPNGTPAFEHLDQNGHGYCWAYSTGHAIMLMRLKMGLPVVRLNPHATAAIIKNGRDEGGWSGLSAKWGREHGYAVEGDGPGQWPRHSRSLQYDTPALREQMALHKITEDWVDLGRDVYDQNLTMAQSNTCSFNNNPGPEDFNFWSHAVCRIRWVRIEAGSWGKLILNSWKGWGRFGLGVLRGSKAKCDGALSVLSTTVSLT